MVDTKVEMKGQQKKGGIEKNIEKKRRAGKRNSSDVYWRTLGWFVGEF